MHRRWSQIKAIKAIKAIKVIMHVKALGRSDALVVNIVAMAHVSIEEGLRKRRALLRNVSAIVTGI